MLQIHSPKFYNSGKNNISAILSPTYRSKRTVSDLLAGQYNHINSCKKLDSSSKTINKKTSQNSQHRVVKLKDVLAEMSTLKQEYTNLKTAYKELMNDRMRQSQKQTVLLEDNGKMKREIEKAGKDNYNLKSKITFLEQEIERIKKQSLKLIEIWQFRMKKVSQDLSQKQKYSSILKKCLKNNGVDLPVEFQGSQLSLNLDIQSRQLHKTSHNSSVGFDESVFFQRMNTDADYITGLDNISMSSIMNKNVTKTDKQNYETVKPSRLHLSSLEDITDQNRREDNKQIVKNQDNLKKLKKQASNKMKVIIIDEKNKQVIEQIQQKMPLDKKNGKSIKCSKVKLKDYCESKSHRKKQKTK